MMWFIFSLMSVFALAIAELTQQRLLNEHNAFNERTSAVFTFLSQSLLIFPVLIFTPLRYEIFDIFQTDIIYKVLAVSIIGALAMVFYFRSFKVKNISISVIFISGSAIVSTTLGIVFFNESAHLLKFVGILLILLAIIILNYKNLILEKNHFFGILAGMMFGITYTLDKSIVAHINPLVYVFWFVLVALFGFLFSPKDVINSVKGKSFKNFIPVIVSGVAYLCYNLFTFFSYRFGGEVGKIDAINNSQIFLIIIFEFLILGQKQSIGRKIVTAVIAFTGVFILGLIN